MHLQLPVTATSTNLETVTMETLASKTMSEAMLISGASKQISCAIFYIFDFFLIRWLVLKTSVNKILLWPLLPTLRRPALFMSQNGLTLLRLPPSKNYLLIIVIGIMLDVHQLLDICSSVKEQGLKLTEKWNTDNTLNASVDYEKLMPGLKLTLDGSFQPNTGDKAGKFKTEYKHERLLFNA